MKQLDLFDPCIVHNIKTNTDLIEYCVNYCLSYRSEIENNSEYGNYTYVCYSDVINNKVECHYKSLMTDDFKLLLESDTYSDIDMLSLKERYPDNELPLLLILFDGDLLNELDSICIQYLCGDMSKSSFIKFTNELKVKYV